MRLHLGAGKKYWPGWHNVDLEGDQDTVCDITKLPFNNDSVDEIQAIHVFEHLHRINAIDALNEWRRVLKPGGKLVLEMPCYDKIISMINSGEKNLRMTMFGLFGDPNEAGEFMGHQWCWSKDELEKQVKTCGFDVDITDPKFHFVQRDMRCEAIKS